MEIASTQSIETTLRLEESSGAPLKALPPQFQTEKEIRAILENEEVKKALNGDDVLEITKHETNNIYYIRTENALIRVLIEYKHDRPSGFVGPAQFDVKFLDKQDFKS